MYNTIITIKFTFKFEQIRRLSWVWIVSGGFGWIRGGFGVDSGGFGWIRVDSGGFGWIRVDSGGSMF